VPEIRKTKKAKEITINKTRKTKTRRTSNLSKAHEMRDSLAVSVPRLSWSNSIHFVAIHFFNLCHSHKLQKTLKPRILGVQGHSGSLMLTPLKNLSLLLVIISSMFVAICNRFHATQTNSGKITTF